MKLTIDWALSSFYGWGIYGLNLALELAKDPNIEGATSEADCLKKAFCTPLELNALFAFARRSGAPDYRARNWVHALGNDFLADSEARIGVIFFESPLSPEAIERARRYDVILTGSTWNESVLRGHGLTNVRKVFQGVDRAYFHPGPRQQLFGDRFLIFSGGKAEPRKGQDIVVKAFRIFRRRHPEAVLVKAWHSPWPEFRAGMDLDLGPEIAADGVIDVGGWPNSAMPAIYRECDVAVFPNRAEGGTNLVAMECLACGVPSIISANTGHLDLVGRGPVMMLSKQRPVPGAWEEWRESDVDEIVSLLEFRFANRRTTISSGKVDLDRLAGFYWSQTAGELVRAVSDVYESQSNICAA